MKYTYTKETAEKFIAEAKRRGLLAPEEYAVAQEWIDYVAREGEIHIDVAPFEEVKDAT